MLQISSHAGAAAGFLVGALISKIVVGGAVGLAKSCFDTSPREPQANEMRKEIIKSSCWSATVITVSCTLLGALVDALAQASLKKSS